MERLFSACSWKVWVLGSAMVLMAGCSGMQPAPVTSKPGVQDGVPVGTLDPSEIQDAVPRPEVPGRAGNFSPYTVLGQTYELLPSGRGYRAEGVASWYGSKFHGRKTANGEVFDAWGMTAAHKSLPIPAYLRVTNLDNGLTTIVRVNDRGPFHGGRIIDLSYAAAVKLGFAEQGTANVRLEAIDFPQAELAAVLPPSKPHQRVEPADAMLYLQVGAFRNPVSAESLRERVASLTGRSAQVVSTQDVTPLHRVRVGPLPNENDVALVRAVLEQAQIASPVLVRESAGF